MLFRELLLLYLLSTQVDMSRPCNMCHVMMPSPAALIEHMNKNHFRFSLEKKDKSKHFFVCFRGLAGLNIVQQGAPSRPSLPTPPSPGNIVFMK